MVGWSIIGKRVDDFQTAEQDIIKFLKRVGDPQTAERIIIKFPIKLVFKLKEKTALRLFLAFGSYDATDGHRPYYVFASGVKNRITFIWSVLANLSSLMSL